MADWKGVKVKIQICDMKDLSVVHSGNEFLDTNTMTDLFEKYNPKDYLYSIIRIREQ